MSEVEKALQNIGFAICEAHENCPPDVWARLNDADHALRLALEAERGASAGIEADLVAAHRTLEERSQQHLGFAQESDDCNGSKAGSDMWRQSGMFLRQAAKEVEAIRAKHFQQPVLKVSP